MKKRNLKSLKLNKKVVSSLEHHEIKGGGKTSWAGLWGYVVSICDDLATINDSCFTLCDNMCNDWDW